MPAKNDVPLPSGPVLTIWSLRLSAISLRMSSALALQ
jgi:hypothetical protein